MKTLAIIILTIYVPCMILKVLVEAKGVRAKSDHAYSTVAEREVRGTSTWGATSPPRVLAIENARTSSSDAGARAASLQPEGAAGAATRGSSMGAAAAWLIEMT